MRESIVIAGGGLGGAAALDVLAAGLDRDRLLAIAPPRETLAPWQSSLAREAETRAVRCLEVPDINAPEVVDEVRRLGPARLISVYHPQIFGPELLGAVEQPALNFHPSLLPRHRGTAPIIWAIAEGDTLTGLSVHEIDAGIDTGDLVYQLPLPIHPQDSGYTLHRKLAMLVRATAAELLRRWLDGRPLPAALAQRGEASNHTRRDATLNQLDFSMPRERVRNVVRALAPPLPCAHALLRGQRLEIARVEAPAAAAPRAGVRPGQVTLAADGAPLVWARDGALRLLEFVDGGELRGGEELAARRGLADGDVLE